MSMSGFCKFLSQGHYAIGVIDQPKTLYAKLKLSIGNFATMSTHWVNKRQTSDIEAGV